MNAVVLQAADRLRPLGEAVAGALARALAGPGETVAVRDLSTAAMPDCKGDLGCWTVTPGVCVHPGVHRDLAAEIVRSDLVAWITPVTFGGYGALLKRLLDHCVPLLSPFFTSVGGETHHLPRYERFPSLLVVGLVEEADPEEMQIFSRLVARNVRNTYAPHYAVVVVGPGDAPSLDALAARWRHQVAATHEPLWPDAPLPLQADPTCPRVRPDHVLLLTGSPRGTASTSGAILRHVDGLLVARGLAAHTVDVTVALRRDPALRLLGEDVEDADAIVLATPLYVDSLPAPLTRALEVLAARTRPPHGLRPPFLGIVNCGFPEAVHCDTGLAILRMFARRAGLAWVGGLAVGGGGLVSARPLAQLGGRAAHLRQALSIAVDALAEGNVLPPEADALARRLPVPAWLYRRFADFGMWREARRHHAAGRLRDRPYA